MCALQGTVDEAAEKWGFESKEEVIKEAVEERILELKKQKFKKITGSIKKKLEEKDVTEEEILKDFEEKILKTKDFF